MNNVKIIHDKNENLLFWLYRNAWTCFYFLVHGKGAKYA